MFSWQMSGEIIIFIILGGVGRLYGPVVGAVVFVALEHILGDLSDYWHIYLGILLLIVVLFARGGLIGMLLGREVAHD
jgi:branched-chain amino acid transport system permease protein